MQLLKIEEFKREDNRQYNFYLLKSFSIIAMLICHMVFRLGMYKEGYENDFSYFFADIILGCYLGVAHAFMFSMGTSIYYSNNQKPIELIKRGIIIYLLGYVLNFFCYGIYALIDGLIEGEFVEETIEALIGQDIFHFAGLALILTGFLKSIKLKDIYILIISLVLSLVGYFLAFTYNGNSFILDFIICHFVYTDGVCSCFSLFHWYIFVAFGLFFGNILKNTKDKDRLYKRVLMISLPIMVAYIVLSSIFGTLFLSKEGEYYALSILEALGLLSIDLVLLSLYHFLLNKVDASKFNLFIVMSKNLTSIYIISWCIIGFLEAVFCYILGIVFNYFVLYLMGIVLVVVSYLISIMYKNIKSNIQLKKQTI